MCLGYRLVTVLLLQSRSVEFDPLPRYQLYPGVAEVEMHLTFNQRHNVGSIPTARTTSAPIVQPERARVS